jgi:hypothetical protein
MAACFMSVFLSYVAGHGVSVSGASRNSYLYTKVSLSTRFVFFDQHAGMIPPGDFRGVAGPMTCGVASVQRIISADW